MIDEKFRKSLDEYCNENGFDNTVVFDNPSYDNSIVGITAEGRLVYDYQKMVEEFAKDNGVTELEAIEFIDYNTIRALPYFGENTPIIIERTKEEIIGMC